MEDLITFLKDYSYEYTNLGGSVLVKISNSWEKQVLVEHLEYHSYTFEDVRETKTKDKIFVYMEDL